MGIHCCTALSESSLGAYVIFYHRTEQNIYFIDFNSTVSRHTYFDITKDSYKVTINVYMDLTTKL